ncbi:MAG: CapA family protein [Desulforhabdus sp.]|nr:CapA family protein [Desulforhabdus sp.]
MLFFGDWIPTEGLDLGTLTSDEMKVINLECAFCSRKKRISKKAYPIVLEVEALDIIGQSRNCVVNIANNHTYDAGESAFHDLIEELDRRGVAYYGTTERPYIEIEDGKMRYFVVAGLSRSRSRGGALAALEKIGEHLELLGNCGSQVVVTPHWGGESEYTPYPSPAQRSLAKKWIDAGANAVFGHHSHTIQGVEYHQGKPIFYSLGNFHFPHEESALYPLTRFGLGVDFAKGEIRKTIILEHRSGRTTVVEDFVKIAHVKKHIEDISDDLMVKKWSLRRWSRAVGRLYTDKNAASWRLRFGKNFLITLPKWLAAQMMPITWLMRMGKILENPDTRCRYEAFDNMV